MPTYYARANGNVNATNVWATTPTGTAGAQTFVAGDILVANSFAITINVDTNLGTGTVTNDNRDGATQGGNFTLSNGVTLTANVVAGNAASTNCLVFSSSGSAAITGNVTGGGGTSAVGAANTSTGTLTITGSVTAGTAASAIGANQTGASPGSLIVVGNCSGGSGVEAYGVGATGGSVTITGSVTGGAGSNSQGARNSSTGTMTITGTCTGASAGFGVGNVSTGTVNVIGTAVGAGSAGATNTSTGTLTVTRAKGGPLASSAAGVNGSATGSTSVSEIEYGDLGASPTSGSIRFTALSSNVAVMYRFGTTKKTLVDADASGLMPAPSNVRSGIVYNGGNSTGTCSIPVAGSVALGAPVDATTGTAALTPASLWDYLTTNASTSGSMGERLRNAATVSSVGQALSDAFG